MTESLIDRVKRLREQTEKQTRDRKLDAKYSRAERVRQDIATTGRFSYQVGQGFLWLRKWIARPLWRWAYRLYKLIIHGYARLWAWVVYRRTSDGVLLFSKTRAAAMIMVTGLFCWYAVLPIIGCVYDTGLYVLTVQHDEHLYLFGSQEIDSTTGMHNIEGANHEPWTDEDSMYFRAENSLFANLWTLIHRGGLYYPEYVGAAVPYGTSRCVVTSYGMRLRMPWLKNTYTYLLTVSCSFMRTGGPS